MQFIQENTPAFSPTLSREISSGLLSKRARGLVMALLLLGASAPAQDVERSADPFDREVEFITFLMDSNLFAYANLAMSELRTAYPNDRDRVLVAEAGVMLRMGRTDDVEKTLAGRSLATDPKAQAILLQLAMTYDSMGKGEQAMAHYKTFMALNEGKEIEDRDVLRYFASAGLRLAAIQNEAKDFEGAAKTLRGVIRAVNSDVLKRKFSVIAAQTDVDHALSLQGAARATKLKQSSESLKEILYGANDNYWFMANALQAYITHLGGDTDGAMKSLAGMRASAQAMETQLDQSQVPKSEYPRASMRYVEGIIQFNEAKKRQAAGGEAEARRLAAQALGNFYNAFLLYDGNDYASRSALLFEDVKAWIKETWGVDPKTVENPKAAELIFKRQLDLAQELLRSGKNEDAERTLLRGLAQYPVTPYTLQALSILGRVWVAQDKPWELMSLAEYAADIYPDNNDAGTLLKLIGNKMVRDENTYGIETVFSAFGRRFPGDPVAADRLLMIGKIAADRGDQSRAIELFDQVLAIYPGSKQATQVLTLRADEAMKANNFEAAIEAFGRVRDQAPPGFGRAQAVFAIANAKLRMKDPEKEVEAVKELVDLRTELDPKRSDSVYYRGADKDRSLNLLQNTRFMISQMLLKKAREQNDEKLRKQAADELNQFLAEYPRAEQAPNVMYSLGRLQLQQGNSAAAAATFERLAKEFPDSDAGRDALYSLVKAALEENQVGIASESVARMVQQPERYEVEKIYQVGVLMLANERWTEAADSFNVVLKNPKTAVDPNLRQRTLYNVGRAALGAGRKDEAIEGLEKFISEFSRSALVVEAGITLADAYIQQNPPQIEKARAAIGQAQRILQQRRTPIDQTRVDLALARINMVDGKPDAALSNLYKAGFSKPETPEHAQLVREAILLAVAEALKSAEAGNASRWQLVAELTDQYIRSFPMDPKAAEMRTLSSRAISLAPQN
jgi:TolA-binding protein